MISSTITILSTCLSVVYAQMHAVREPAPAAITAAPMLARQAQQGFVGYYSTPGDTSWHTAECLTSRTFTTSGSYGACWNTADGRATIPTGCSGPYALFPGSSLSCSSTCNTDFVIRTANDANPTLWIGCDDDGLQTNFYQTMPSSNVPAQPTTSSTVTITPTPTPTPTPSPTPTPTPSPKKSSSKAWIAGVVVGPLVVLAIAGLLIWIFCLKKKNKKTQASQPQAYQAAPAMQQAPQQQYMQPPPGAEQRYSTPAPQYTNAPYQQTQSPPPGQQWAQTPSPQPTAVSPMSGAFGHDKAPLMQSHDSQYLDSKAPISPVPTVSEIASPQTYGSGTPSGTVSEIASPQPYPAHTQSQQNFGAAAGPVATHLPPSHHELQ